MKNPQALPSMRRNEDGSVDYLEGMTLLDYFAGQAISSDNLKYGIRKGNKIMPDSAKIAKYAYDIAEAMLKERERRENAKQ